jgi:hypothetical protein
LSVCARAGAQAAICNYQELVAITAFNGKAATRGNQHFVHVLEQKPELRFGAAGQLRR